jgi:hypothetical protein
MELSPTPVRGPLTPYAVLFTSQLSLLVTHTNQSIRIDTWIIALLLLLGFLVVIEPLPLVLMPMKPCSRINMRTDEKGNTLLCFHLFMVIIVMATLH